MTAQNVWQIALVTGAGCLFLGHIGTLLFDRYRKGGERDLENWLDAEVEQGVKLLKENEELKTWNTHLHSEFFKMRFALEHPDLSVEGTEGGASDNPGHVDNAGASSSNWNCEEQGHRYVMTNINGELTRVCMHCDLNGGTAA